MLVPGIPGAELRGHEGFLQAGLRAPSDACQRQPRNAAPFTQRQRGAEQPQQEPGVDRMAERLHLDLNAWLSRWVSCAASPAG